MNNDHDTSNDQSSNNYLDTFTDDNDGFDIDFVYSNSTRVEVELLKLLNEICAPHYAYKVIMEWTADAYNSGYNFLPKCKTYQQKI